MKVTIYTDGASRGNPGRGGYGAVLRYTAPSGTEHTLELSRGYARTTNNRMELMGVIAALERLNRPCEVEVHSDSQYVVNAFNKHWVDGWKKRGWKTAAKKPVKNPDLSEAPARRHGAPSRDLCLGARTRRARHERALRRARDLGGRQRPAHR